VVGFVLAVLASWLWVLSELWVGLGGWASLVWVPLALGFVTCVAPLSVIHWWQAWPQARPLLIALALAALVLRVGAVTWVIRRTRRQGLVRDRVLAAAVAGWLGLAALSAGLVCWLAGGGAAMFAGVVLLLPLARPLAMPLALAHNRHR
jgi:hypothetical protein